MKAKNYIFEKLTALMAAKGLDLPAKTTIEAPKSEQHGDMATNIAMVMPKEKGQNPRAVAEALKAELLAMCPEIDSIEIAGPGFINFTFKPVFWQEVALAALEGSDDFGRISVGQGRKVQVE
jgi:arginyl-tRNA synthetase